MIPKFTDDGSLIYDGKSKLFVSTYELIIDIPAIVSPETRIEASLFSWEERDYDCVLLVVTFAPTMTEPSSMLPMVIKFISVDSWDWAIYLKKAP